MFYQVPIRVPVSELAFDLSTPEACFAAESAEDCFAALKAWRDTLLPQKNISLSRAVAMICSENNNVAVERMVSRLSVLSMFTLISSKPTACYPEISINLPKRIMHLLIDCAALYKLAQQLVDSLVGFAVSPALKLGLRNWCRLWPSEFRDFELLDMTEASSGQWFQRIGFQRYAPEYWMYTYFTIERAQHRSSWDQAVDWEIFKHDDTDKIRFSVLLREFEFMEISTA